MTNAVTIESIWVSTMDQSDGYRMREREREREKKGGGV